MALHRLREILSYLNFRELAEKNRPYDAVTLGEWFESQGLAEQVAGGAYLVELASTTPSAANIFSCSVRIFQAGSPRCRSRLSQVTSKPAWAK